ncbi:uncharacterized protein IAS62_001618 [Cryptococcus decagattii]|uniref:Uncharacterized protein n=1 Tax=Cryptococcus decagattii TaxID=1859122 RepID=A0ABZ2AR09_9TREE
MCYLSIFPQTTHVGILIIVFEDVIPGDGLSPMRACLQSSCDATLPLKTRCPTFINPRNRLIELQEGPFVFEYKKCYCKIPYTNSGF